MSEELKLALTSPQEMDYYLEVHTGQEIIDHIKAALEEAHNDGIQAVLYSEDER